MIDVWVTCEGFGSGVSAPLGADQTKTPESGAGVGGCMDDYRVVLEAAWQVRDVDEAEDAIGIAVSEAGRRLNDQDLAYVDVAVGFTTCPSCGEAFDAALVAARTALVGLLLQMDVFNAENEEHAARIAESEVGGALRDVPIEVLEVEPLEEDEGDGVDVS